MNKIVAGGIGLLAMAVLTLADNMGVPFVPKSQPENSKGLHWANTKSRTSHDDFERQWEETGRRIEEHSRMVREGVAANRAKAEQISKEMDENIAAHEAKRQKYDFEDLDEVGKDMPMQPPTQKKQE